MATPVSVVMEWDNQRLAATSRAAACFAALAPQLAAPPAGHAVVELILAYDPARVAAAELAAFARAHLGGEPVPLVLEPVPGAAYYELKNAGVRVARGEVVAFVDSDVIPEPGWLAGLLGALADPAVAFACGHTYVATETFLGRAYAAAWIFPARLPVGPPYPVTRACGHGWHANNFAAARALLLANPFPPEPWRNRGSCTSLGRRLRAEGVGLTYVPAARATHPTPNGVVHTVSWWMNHGREVLDALAPGGGPPAFLARAAFQTARRIAWACRNTVRDRRRTGLRWHELPAALALMACLHAIHLPGMVWGRYAPRSFDRLFET